MITIREARQELYDVFADSRGRPRTWLKGRVAKVYDHEPFGGLLIKPASITVRTGGLQPDEIILELRIYVDASNNAQKSADLLDEIMELIEFGNTQNGIPLSYIPSTFTLGEWETAYETDLKAWGALARLSRGREDF